MILHINSTYPWHCGSGQKAIIPPYDYDYQSTTNEKDVTCEKCLALKLEYDFGKYKASFPLVKFAKENTLSEQVSHVYSEAHEAIGAYVVSNNFLAMELLDVIHSAETALHILATQHGIDIDAAKRQVIAKNRDRGYYTR